MIIPDIIGTVYNYLTVVKRSENQRRHICWECKCICGNIKKVRWSELKRGGIKSCGCHPIGRAAIKEGVSYRTPEYNVWASMLARCKNPNNKKYHLYGAAGVVVCERWKTFSNFLEDMDKRPSDKHSLDRFPDKDGNYEPSNCRWATIHEQNRNLRSNIWIEYNGKPMILKDWCTSVKIDYSTIRKKLKKGESFVSICKKYEHKINVAL